MRIVTWNVNSIRTRLSQLQTWLSVRHYPEIVCLQETKVVDELFPLSDVQAVGYTAEFFGQKSYNGVCILSRFPMSDVVKGIGQPTIDREARVISATIKDFRIINVYVPNGQAPGSEKYAWKFEFFKALLEFIRAQKKLYPKLIVCGDINIAH
ncbi:endonuclease/exonuclease/phosphatase family protein, partial [Candidatus Falkowbacteria bacterium]|nr:endonuclease/exonuclease/phosphatase family protein [Candidatus Falkowbacteria bacterium]